MGIYFYKEAEIGNNHYMMMAKLNLKSETEKYPSPKVIKKNRTVLRKNEDSS